MIKKCSGCGYPLQSENKEKLGYQPKLENKTLCERCFKIIHYNDAKIVTLDIDQNAILKIVNKSKAHALFLIDFLNINSTTIETFQNIKIGKTLLISKCDVIPFSMNLNKIKSWLKEYYHINDEIIFISCKKNKNINYLINYLTKHNYNNVYLLGFTNAGKSSLLNTILKTKELNFEITTSIVPNTTLDFMNIKIDDNLTIIDSPGFTLKDAIFESDDINIIKRINPKKFLKPVTYQMKDKQAIKVLDNLIIENLSQKNSFTFYMSNNLELKKVFKIGDQDLQEKVIEVDNNCDLVIKGLGFINIKQKGQVKVYINNKDLIEVRKSLF